MAKLAAEAGLAMRIIDWPHPEEIWMLLCLADRRHACAIRSRVQPVGSRPWSIVEEFVEKAMAAVTWTSAERRPTFFVAAGPAMPKPGSRSRTSSSPTRTGESSPQPLPGHKKGRGGLLQGAEPTLCGFFASFTRSLCDPVRIA